MDKFWKAIARKFGDDRFANWTKLIAMLLFWYLWRIELSTSPSARKTLVKFLNIDYLDETPST